MHHMEHFCLDAMEGVHVSFRPSVSHFHYYKFSRAGYKNSITTLRKEYLHFLEPQKPKGAYGQCDMTILGNEINKFRVDLAYRIATLRFFRICDVFPINGNGNWLTE